VNEKKYKIIIIILSIVCAISIGLCIYYGRADASRLGEELSTTIRDQRDTIVDQRRTIEQLQDDLSGARTATESALRRAGDAERELGTINGLVGQSIERVNRLGTGTADLVERQRLINDLFAKLAANYNKPKTGP